MNCVRVEAFAAWCNTNAMSNTIRVATTPIRFRLTGRTDDVPSHVGNRLTLEDGSQWAAHATLGRDWCIQPWNTVAQDYAGKGSWIKVTDLKLCGSERELVYSRAMDWRGRYFYSIKQLWLMLLNRVCHTQFRATKRDGVCSEFFLRLLKGILDKALKLAARLAKPDYFAPIDVVLALERLGYEWITL